MQSGGNTFCIWCFVAFSCLLAECFVSRFGRSTPPPSSSKNTHMMMKQSIWENARVEYFNPDYAETSECTTARPLPLFLLGGALFPGAVTTLNVYEMRYRTMMFDCAKSDDMFGYIHVDRNTGNIATYGTLVKIIKRELLEDGCQVIDIEGVSRFRVRKIISTLPYCKAEVEPDVIDNIPSDENAPRSAELKAYNSLKYFMRLMAFLRKKSTTVVPLAVKKSRPTLRRPDVHMRRMQFSFALSSMFMLDQDRAQILLQSLDLEQRLLSQNTLLTMAADEITSQLIEGNLLTAAERDGMKLRAVNSDFDEDILPPDEVTEEVVEEKDEWDISNME